MFYGIWRNLAERLNAERIPIIKVQKCVNHVDLVKSFETIIYYLLANFGVDTAENGPLKVCQQLARS